MLAERFSFVFNGAPVTIDLSPFGATNTSGLGADARLELLASTLNQLLVLSIESDAVHGRLKAQLAAQYWATPPATGKQSDAACTRWVQAQDAYLESRRIRDFAKAAQDCIIRVHFPHCQAVAKGGRTGEVGSALTSQHSA